MIASLLIANRGEIACRVIRTARLWDDGIIDPAQTRDMVDRCGTGETTREMGRR